MTSILTTIGGALALVVGLALGVFLLLASFPFLPNLFEFLWSSFLAVRLHSNVSIEMVQSTICLFATVPAALIHSFDFLVAAAGSLMLLGTRDWDEGVDLARALLRSRGGRVCVDIMTRGHRASAMLRGITCPFGSGLRVHVRVGVRVIMRHVWSLRIGRVLSVRIGRTGLGNIWIYRHLGVRIDDGGLMASPIRLGQRRTVVWLLRHTADRGG